MIDINKLKEFLKSSFFINGSLDYLFDKSKDFDFLKHRIEDKDYLLLMRDFNFLFPYKGDKKIKFDYIYNKNKSFYLIETFSFDKNVTPFSPLTIKNYSDTLKEEFIKNKIPESYYDNLINYFSYIVERLVVIEFLNQEPVLKDNYEYNFKYALVYEFDQSKKEELSLFTSTMFSFKRVIKNVVEKSGLLEKDYSKVLHQVIYRGE